MFIIYIIFILLILINESISIDLKTKINENKRHKLSSNDPYPNIPKINSKIFAGGKYPPNYNDIINKHINNNDDKIFLQTNVNKLYRLPNKTEIKLQEEESDLPSFLEVGVGSKTTNSHPFSCDICTSAITEFYQGHLVCSKIQRANDQEACAQTAFAMFWQMGTYFKIFNYILFLFIDLYLLSYMLCDVYSINGLL